MPTPGEIIGRVLGKGKMDDLNVSYLTKKSKHGKKVREIEEEEEE